MSDIVERLWHEWAKFPTKNRPSIPLAGVIIDAANEITVLREQLAQRTQERDAAQRDAEVRAGRWARAWAAWQAALAQPDSGLD